MDTTKYDTDLTGKSTDVVADLIVQWREDEETSSPFSEACDLLNSIEPFLRSLAHSNGLPLSFTHFNAVNLNRANDWHKTGIEEWSVADWAVAMAGEAGEICDAVKKLRRIECAVESNNARQPETVEKAMKAIAQEIGDTAVYLDLLASRCGLRLEDCIRDTFNRISERENMPQRL